MLRKFCVLFAESAVCTDGRTDKQAYYYTSLYPADTLLQGN